MKNTEIIKSYLLMLLGLIVCALGVCFLTKAGLGTSPIAALPYSISLIFPCLSFGGWMILYCFAFILLQIIIEGKQCKPIELILQVIISLTFGYFTDFFMLLLRDMTPEAYMAKLLFLILGCAILALGAALEITAQVAMLPLDALYNCISKKMRLEYFKIRVVSDIGLVILAATLCLCFLGELRAVREGTILAAIITGNFVKHFMRLLAFVK